MTESSLLPQNPRVGRPPRTVPFVSLERKVPPEIRTMLEECATQHAVARADLVSRAIESYAARERQAVAPCPRIVVRAGQE